MGFSSTRRETVVEQTLAHRSGVTAADYLAVPATPTTADVATGGVLSAGTTYKAAVAAANRWGPTTPSSVASQATAADASNTHMVRLTVAQITGAEFYDIFLSTDAAPKYVGRCTEAQRAGGCLITAIGRAVGDLAAGIAGKIRTALAADPDVSAFFNITGSTTAVIATAKAKAANDATMNIAVADGTSAGVTAAASSADTTAGVAPVLQVETATVAGTVTLAGNATVIVTAAGMTNSPKTIAVAVALNDTASQVAGKIRAALAADVDVSAFFTVSGTTTHVVLTALAAAANDGTMNIDIDNGTCTGITTAHTSANTTAGVAGTAQVETATVAGAIYQSGNVSVTVTAAGMTNSPKTISVAVVNTGSVAGSIDVGVVGTGVASTAAPFAANNAVALPAGIGCAGYSEALATIKLSVTDLRSQPSYTVDVYLTNNGSDWYLSATQSVTLGAAGTPLEQALAFDLSGASQFAVAVRAIAGQGASMDVNVTMA